MKTLITNSLFYGKYPYKVICRVQGAWRWRIKFTRGYWYTYNSSDEDEKNGQAFYKTSEKYFNDPKIKTRIEHSLTSFYFNDENFIEPMKKELSPWIREIHQPATLIDKDYLLNNPKKVVCDQYPKKRFKYMIFLKTRIPAVKKESFYNWVMKNNYDKISMPDSTIRFFQNKKWYGEFYIRVEDQATLLLVQLFLAEDIAKTVEYVLRDSINTQTGTE